VKRTIILGIVAAATAASMTAVMQTTRADSTGTVSVTLPPPNVQLNPGPNLALAQGKCLICHSADYIYTQPPLTAKQWTAEVTKMQKAYGAPIADADIGPLVDYLMSQNGKPG
jgi:hypothetical protein